MNKEIINAIKATKTATELKEVAAKRGYVLNDEEANNYFDIYHKCEKIAENELDNVSGGSTCKGGKTYSTDPKHWHWLITTAGNHCPAYVYEPDPGRRMGGAKNTCHSCGHEAKEGLVSYCAKRTLENDPYR